MNSSSSEDEIEDNNAEHLIVLLVMKELEGEKKRKRRGSKVNHHFIPLNLAFGHVLLMKDYFTSLTTYPPHLFRRCHRMRRYLFVHVSKPARPTLAFLTHRRNDTDLIGFSVYQKTSDRKSVV